VNSPSERAQEHETTWKLLPWYLNGTLTEEVAEAVREHLVRCVTCRAEAEEQETLRQHIASTDSRPERAPAAFADVMNRIDSDSTSAPHRGLWPAALRLAAVLVVALGIWSVNRPNEFDVLSTPEVCTGDLSIKFTPEATPKSIDEFLASQGLKVACEPSGDQLYKVQLVEPRGDETIGDFETLALGLEDRELVALALATQEP